MQEVREEEDKDTRQEARYVRCPVCGERVSYYKRRHHRCLRAFLHQMEQSIRQVDRQFSERVTQMNF